MKKMSENVGGWLRGLVWTAMIFGCAWASAQNYLVTSPEGTYKLEAKNSGEGVGPGHSYVLASPAGRYHTVAMGEGEGVGLGHGVGVEGAQNAEPAPKDDLFANTEVFAKNATHVTEITMDPDTLSMVGGSDEHKAHNMVLNVVRSYTYDKPGMYNMADVEALRNKLNTGDWHCSVHSRDLKTGEGSDICGKRRTDGMKEQVIMEVSPTHLTFIHTIRRAGTGGTGEVGLFPMMRGTGGLSSLAMLDPEALAYMEMGLHGMPFMLMGPGSPMMLTMPGSGLYTLKMPDMTELNEKFKELKVKPFDPEQMKKFNEQMKAFKDFQKDKEMAPAAPAMPKGTPVPEAAPTPKTPE
jgi:hypothetical protein